MGMRAEASRGRGARGRRVHPGAHDPRHRAGLRRLRRRRHRPEGQQEDAGDLERVTRGRIGDAPPLSSRARCSAERRIAGRDLVRSRFRQRSVPWSASHGLRAGCAGTTDACWTEFRPAGGQKKWSRDGATPPKVARSGTAWWAAGRGPSSAPCTASRRGWTTSTSWSPARCLPTPKRAIASAKELGLAPDRSYGSYEEMAKAEGKRPGRHRGRRRS